MAGAAKRTGSAIVAVRHLRKGGAEKSGKAIYAGIGSIDFTAAVRSVMPVMESKGGTKFVYHAKHNRTPKGDSVAYGWGENKAWQWEGTVQAEELAGVDGGKAVSTTPRMMEQAEAFLFEILKDGPVPAVDVLHKASEAKLPPRTLNRAKKGLVHSEKHGDQWFWALNAREGMGDVVSG